MSQYSLNAMSHKIILCFTSWSFRESKRNPYWVIMLMSSHGTNYVLNDNEFFSRYGPYALPPEIMPCYSYHVSLVNQNEISIELSY